MRGESNEYVRTTQYLHTELYLDLARPTPLLRTPSPCSLTLYELHARHATTQASHLQRLALPSPISHHNSLLDTHPMDFLHTASIHCTTGILHSTHRMLIAIVVLTIESATLPFTCSSPSPRSSFLALLLPLTPLRLHLELPFPWVCFMGHMGEGPFALSPFRPLDPPSTLCISFLSLLTPLPPSTNTTTTITTTWTLPPCQRLPYSTTP